MQAKEFQRKALERLGLYLEELVLQRAKATRAAQVLAENPDLGIEVPDFTVAAWRAMQERGEVGRNKKYSPRRTGTGEPVPNVTFRVPTGGGKTFMAVQAVGKIMDTYWGAEKRKFVLWVVPSEAIYAQTKRHLLNRQSPLRQSLDTVSGNRVRVLEKESVLNAADLEGHLNIMLLMLQSANRSKGFEKLKLRQDRGSISGFLPEEDDFIAHRKLLESVPNLEPVLMADLLAGLGETALEIGLIRSSTANALRLLRPLIVLDEGHKGFTDSAYQVLYGYNPRFVLELSATPRDGKDRHSNWLVNVSGVELDAEEMIKMPIMLHVTPEQSWRACVREAWQQVVELQTKADEHLANTRRYIRPILLVQVERTGKDQREAGYVHTDDVREYLAELGVADEAIAVKTSDTDELKTLEVKNLLDPQCPIRVIITKSALQEGWDCSFAYVLCSLAVSRSASAMTQLVGRILRMPEAKKTGIEELDQCYVYTYRQTTQAAVEIVQKGLTEEGLDDLAGKIVNTGQSAVVMAEPRKRQEGLGGRKFYLPQVLVHEGGDKVRPVDWEADILGGIDWSSAKLTLPESGLPKGDATATGSSSAIYLDAVTQAEGPRFATEYDHLFAMRALAEVIPNPWIADAWAREFFAALLASGWKEEEAGQRQQYVVSSLVQLAAREVDGLARAVFEAKLESGEIVFDLVAEQWWSVPERLPAAPLNGATGKLRDDGLPFEKALFPPVYESELNGLEYKAACFADRSEAVWWWYKNVVKGAGYSLQGWRRNRIYPDFIIAQEKDGEVESWVVIETKGEHLADNHDSVYKKEVMSALTSAYGEGKAATLGQLTLFEKRARYVCEMVTEGNFDNELRNVLQ